MESVPERASNPDPVHAQSRHNISLIIPPQKDLAITLITCISAPFIRQHPLHASFSSGVEQFLACVRWRCHSKRNDEAVLTLQCSDSRVVVVVVDCGEYAACRDGGLGPGACDRGDGMLASLEQRIGDEGTYLASSLFQSQYVC
jgi:hypothetical protein